jgi:hypothetical protein
MLEKNNKRPPGPKYFYMLSLPKIRRLVKLTIFFSAKFIEPVGRLENFEDTITHITPFGNNKAKVLT